MLTSYLIKLSRFVCLYLILLGVISPNYLYGKTHGSSTDSILSLIQTAKDDTIIFKHYLNLNELHKGSTPDTALYFLRKMLHKIEYGEFSRINEWYGVKANNAMASLCVYMGRIDSAEVFNQIASESALKYGFKDLSPSISNMFGLIAFNKSDFDGALLYYNKALEEARNVGDLEYMAKVYSNKAIIKFYQGDYTNATELFKKPVAIAKQLGDYDLLSGSYINVGLIYANIGVIDSAAYYYNESLKIYHKINGLDGALLCYQNLGSLEYGRGNYAQAFSYFKESVTLSEQVKDLSNKAKGLHDIGNVYFDMGDYASAHAYFLKALKIKEELQDQKTYAISLVSLGNVSFQLKEDSIALVYYQKALNIYKNIKYRKGEAKVLSNIAQIKVGSGAYLEADSVYTSCELIFKEIQDYPDLSDLYLSHANLNLLRENYAEAYKKARQALKIKQEIEDRNGEAKTLILLAKLNKASKQYSKGLRNATQARKIAQTIHALPVEIESLAILKSLHKAMGNYTLAFSSSEDYIKLQNEQNTIEYTKQIKYADAKYKIEANQHMIEKLAYQLEVDQQRVRLLKADTMLKSRQIGLLIITSLLLIVAIVFVVYYWNIKNKTLEDKQLRAISMLRLQNIRNRISPHFFFNALSNSTLPFQNHPQYREQFEKLVALLRNSLTTADKPYVTLKEELSMVYDFIDIKTVKYGNDFTFVNEVDINTPEDCIIPTMLLQIPIENAIKHGLDLKEGEKVLMLKITEEAEKTLFLIEDNGVGLKNSLNRTKGTGTGQKILNQTIHYLNEKNAEKIEYSISDLTGTMAGVQVRIEIPKNYNFD